jgi:NADH-quinone oxidoreductase subunit A
MTSLVFYLLLFILIGFGFIWVHLVAGKFFRPIKPDPEKQTIYECGEPTIGSAWVQFDLRYYVVALLFVIFDVEVAFFFPWAVVFGDANTLANNRLPADSLQVKQARQDLLPDQEGLLTEETRETAGRFARLALLDIAVFFGVLLVGFAYLWKRGDINWVRSTAAEKVAEEQTEPARKEPVLAGADQEW